MKNILFTLYLGFMCAAGFAFAVDFYADGSQIVGIGHVYLPFFAGCLLVSALLTGLNKAVRKNLVTLLLYPAAIFFIVWAGAMEFVSPTDEAVTLPGNIEKNLQHARRDIPLYLAYGLPGIAVIIQVVQALIGCKENRDV